MIYRDQLNRKIELKQSPNRIVSLVPSQTELLVDLGLIDQIVGVTKFCIHPYSLRKTKSVVGGTKQISFEKIKALQPDIILCNKEENTKEMMDKLKSIAPIHISDIYTVEDCLELIKTYGQIFNKFNEASMLMNAIKTEKKAFHSQLSTSNKMKVAYFIWKNPFMVAASNTFIHSMLNEAHFINVFEDEERYPEIQLDHPKIKEADCIFLSSEPYPFKEKDIEEFKKQFPSKKVMIVDGEMFSWYGSRICKSYRYFKSHFIA